MDAPFRPSRPIGKKLVIACDGTWQNSDAGYDKSPFMPPKAQYLTNVTRIVRALNHRDENGVPQIVYYQRGIGTEGDIEDKIVGGLTGNSITEHIREAYAFIANNYDPYNAEELEAALKDQSMPMDDIVLFGFSRGAYTARAIASLITDMGLLTKLGMEQFWGIFTDWKNQDVDGQQSEWFKKTFPTVASDFKAKNGRDIIFTDPMYRNTLKEKKLTRWGMPIRAVGVWDTVGSLGIPMPFNAKNVKPYSFVSTKVPQQVEYAFHAMAIDERRNLFPPTIWEKPDPYGPGQPARLKKLKQVWFPGSHSNVGGGYADQSNAIITLAWMISQLEDNGSILSFNHEYLDFVQDLANRFYIESKQPTRPWGFGTLYDSSIIDSPTSLAEGLNPVDRTAGRYQKTDTKTGKPSGIPLVETHEFIHRSVRHRLEGEGPGIQAWTTSSKVDRFLLLGKQALGLNPHILEETKSYAPRALKNFALVDDKTQGVNRVLYQAHDNGTNLFEDEMGKTELRLLERSTKLPKS